MQGDEAAAKTATIMLQSVRRQWLSLLLAEASLAPSVGEAKRLISRGTVGKNAQRVTAYSMAEDLWPGDILNMGKHPHDNGVPTAFGVLNLVSHIILSKVRNLRPTDKAKRTTHKIAS